MNKENLSKQIDLLSSEGEWNHCYEFPFGLKTRRHHIQSPGYNLNKWERLEPVIELLEPSGKTLLDVGCSDGFFSIMSANKGMDKVLGIDLDPLRIRKANFAKEVYGVNNVDFKVFDLYDFKEQDSYDIILGLGLIHRVPDIETCLKKLSTIGENIILEFKTYDSEEPVCKYRGGNTKSNIYNALHYIPTKSFMIEKMTGLGMGKYQVLDDEKSGLEYKRTMMMFSRGA